MKNNHYLWWQTGVIYQVYPRSYRDTTGNGVGDLPGVIEKLPYLSELLQIDAIWLSPFYPSPMKDFGYDVSDYTAVHPLFGTMDDFDRLLEEAHARGIKIIIDLVPNHSSDQHIWFQESRSSRDNPKRDWYIWADPKPDGSPPNNWLSVFGGPAWEWDDSTGQYYLHSFLKEQPDLNWRNPDVREAFHDVIRFWLEKGVDGFRIDVAHYIMKDPQMRDNPINPETSPSIHRSLGEYDSQFHLYDKGHPDNHHIYQEIRKLLDDYEGEGARVSIGEIHIVDYREWASYYGQKLDEIHLPFNFGLLGIKWTAEQVSGKVNALEAALPEGAWPNYVLGNHDEKRLASRIGKQQTGIAALLLLTLRGTPTIYYGEEIGMTNVDIPPGQQVDPAGLQQPGQGQGRDLCRTPMQWKPGSQAGFSDADSAELWLPLAPDYPAINVESQLQEPDSLLNLYRRILKFRKSHRALQVGSYQQIRGLPAGCYGYKRCSKEETLLVYLNFTGKTIDLEMQGELLLSTYLESPPSGNIDCLHPHEGIILKGE